MTQQRSEAPRLRANLARSGKGLGLAPTSNFLWFDRGQIMKNVQLWPQLPCLPVREMPKLTRYRFL